MSASNLNDIVYIICLQFHPPIQILLYIKGVFLVIIRCELEVRVLCKVVLIGKEWPHSSELQDALAAIHDRYFISRHQVPSILSRGEFSFGQKNTPFIRNQGSKQEGMLL